ncbi:MAG: hypothetical protein KJI72_01390 [Patescibacteria group bacterium]|nr:hypothetical protein [Patescibacteria group bacterium]
MAKTSRDTWKHIREWSGFFKDEKAVTEASVDKFLTHHKKRKHLKQSLDRLIKRGFIKERGGKLTPTDNGIRFFRKHTGARQNPKRWDGKWRLISFDVPGGYSIKRDQLRALLKEFNFYPLQKSVWVCPSYVADEFWKLVTGYDLDKYCKVMLVDIVEGDKELKNHFRRFIS